MSGLSRPDFLNYMIEDIQRLRVQNRSALDRFRARCTLEIGEIVELIIIFKRIKRGRSLWQFNSVELWQVHQCCEVLL